MKSNESPSRARGETFAGDRRSTFSKKKAPGCPIIMFWQAMTVDIHEDGDVCEGSNE